MANFDFVEKPLAEFFCPVTSELLLDPVRTSCCWKNLSRAVAQAAGKPCLFCNTPLVVVEDADLKRRVEQLKVRCTNKFAGCEWKGMLVDLEGHLKLGSTEGNCDFVQVLCDLKCGKRVQRCNRKSHQSKECENRPFSCVYCDKVSTHKAIVNNHWPICQRFPLVCPYVCSVEEKIERRFLQRHMDEECPKVKVPCKFSFAGCKVKLKRDLVQQHLDTNKDEHLEMIASECKKLKADVGNLQLVVAQISPFLSPLELAMSNFERFRSDGTVWRSNAFYTHFGGYKLCLGVSPNGWAGDSSTCVGVAIYMMKGEFDSRLKWPFKGAITVELINQRKGGESCKKVIVDQHTDPRHFERVTEGDIREDGWGYPQFISHSDLYKPEESKEYLVNDTLIFRVTKIEVFSV